MRLETVLAGLVRRHPEREAVICGGDRLTYAGLAESAARIANGLADLGIGAGDRVVLYLPNSVAFVQLFYGLLHLGAVTVPITTRHTVSELDYFLEDSGARLVVLPSDLADRVEPRLAASVASVVVGPATERSVSLTTLLQAPPHPQHKAPIDQEICLISYTSGTTGRPKGAIATHANIVIQHGFVHAVEWGIGADDRYLVSTPLAHRTGFGRLANALTLGGTAVVLPRFDAAEAVRLIKAERVTVMGMVPTVCRMLLPEIAEDPKACASLALVLVTGEAFPVTLKRRFLELLPETRLVSFFAMTEAGAVTSLGHDEQFTHPTSVGRPTPGVEVRIVGDDGRDRAAGEVGELLVRAGQPGAFTVMKGYFNQPAETETALSDGWLHTGDLAYQDADGYLYIADRKKDMILSGGFNIYSKEVEQTLIAYPGIADAAVVGVPDDVYGEAVTAFIEAEPGARLDRDAILAHCKDLMASYKKPKHLIFVEALPRNSVGKVLKRELAATARDDLGPPTSPSSR